jgi:RNA polymerase sigma-70 factor (ECF subfamily)
MAYLATGHREDALDLVQDAMLKLVQRYAARAEQEWGPLFHQILQSRIRDGYRRSRVRNRWRVWFGNDPGDGADQPDPIQDLADASNPDPMERMAEVHATTAVEAALRQLPLRQQQVFLLRVWEGLDVAATAKAMGCSAGSVKTHYSRAVHSLRISLEDHR